MLIKEIMNKKVRTVPPDTKLNEAYKIMIDNNIRHLPIAEDGELIGIITDRDLRYATSRLTVKRFLPEDKVERIMITSVKTASPNDPIELAVRVMREFKIGCLPIIENDKIVGIITGMDVLDAFIKLTGIRKPSGRLELRLSDAPGELAKIANIFADKKINIHSILTYTENGEKHRVILRINTMEIRQIAEILCHSGIEVIWPPHISCKE